jgi:signal transduction histidine kinase
MQQTVTDIGAQIYVAPARRGDILMTIEREGSISQCESQWRRRDGTVIWVSEDAHVVRDAAGSLRYYEGTVRDISARKRAEDDRQELQNRLIALSRRAGMAEVATGVLHNVGNVLNSVNVSATVVADKLRQSELPSLAKVNQLIQANRQNLATFLTDDARGKLVPDFIADLGQCLAQEQQAMLGELSTLVKGIEHIKEIVTTQQSLARESTVLLPAEPAKLMEAAIAMQGDSLERHGIEVVRQFNCGEPIAMDKHKVLQILINLISNAKHAVKLSTSGDKRMTLVIDSVHAGERRRLRFVVKDTGVGIPAENLTRIFSHGFTTKVNGHGFGLHSAANAATEMGGSLSGHSDGPGRGACFTLELPAPANRVGESCKH